MGLFLLGVLVGGAAALFWVNMEAGATPFAKHLSRELAARGRLDRLDEPLRARVESLERELALLRAARACSSPPPSPPVPSKAAAPPDEPGETACARACPPGAGGRKGRVLELLGRGCAREEILRETRLGKGALDLILSLREKGVL